MSAFATALAISLWGEKGAEITPKVYARYFNEQVSLLTAPILNAIMAFFAPYLFRPGNQFLCKAVAFQDNQQCGHRRGGSCQLAIVCLHVYRKKTLIRQMGRHDIRYFLCGLYHLSHYSRVVSTILIYKE